MKAVKRAILLCWFMLVVCLVIKLIGGNWFEIICDNEHFIFVCDYIDKHWYIRYPIGYVLYTVSTVFVLLSTSFIVKPTLKQLGVILLSTTLVWFSSLIPTKHIQIVKLVLEIVMFLVLPFILHSLQDGFACWKTTLKKTWFLGIIGYIFVLCFQTISLVTKNLGIKITDNNSLLTFILMIDYYIMITLYYLYVVLKKKREEA